MAEELLRVRSADQGEQRLRVVREIKDLSPSPIKDALVTRVLPYFELPPPFTLNRSGLNLEVEEALITYQASTVVGARLTYLGEPSRQTQAIDTSRIEIPLLHTTDEDEEELPKDEDGSYWGGVEIPKGERLPYGIRPKITINPRPISSRSEDIAFDLLLDRFVLVKEACTLLVYDVHAEEMFRKMKESGVQTHILANDDNGKPIQQEIITLAQNTLVVFGGRTNAALDLAGYLVTFKTIAKSPLFDLAMRNNTYKPVLDMLPNVELGVTPQEIFYRSFRAVMANPVVRTLGHIGNLDQLP